MVGMVAAVAAVALPAAAVLMPSSPESAVAAVAPVRVAQTESLATLLTGSELKAAETSAVSPVSAMLIASTVSADFSGPPYYYFGDVDGNGITNLTDFGILKENFGLVGPTAVRGTGDLTGDFIVSLDDFLVVKFFFGAKSPFLP
jgi:hypothetical protein